MQPNVTKLFNHLAGALLLGVATGFLLVNSTNAALAQAHEPFLALSINTLFWLGSCLTFLVAMYCLFGAQPLRQAALVIWLAVAFLLYQAGLVLSGARRLSAFLAGFKATFGISPGIAGWMLEIIFALLLLGGCASFLVTRLGKTAPARSRCAADGLKIHCPACGGKIMFSPLNAGQKTACPHCQSVIALQSTPNFKIYCDNCAGRLEFPSHALGQKIACPHCQSEITLLKPL